MSKLDFLQQKKLSRADELRETLSSLEERRVDLKSMDSAQALLLLGDLDTVYHLFEQLEATNQDLIPERGRFRSVQGYLKRSAARLLKTLGGPAALAEARPRPDPTPEQWWWDIDTIVAAQRRRLRRRVLIGVGIVALLIGGIILVFNTILAPSPEVVARIQAENAAFAAIDAGNYQQALAVIETGLQAVPDDPGLSIFQGVLQEVLGDEAGAAQSFERTQAGLADPQYFYFSRCQLYLRLNQPEKAEADAQAAINIDKNSAEAWLLLGQALETQSKTVKAMQAYQLASDLGIEHGNNEVVVLARLGLGRLGLAR
jgi:tetratricopeptide (TPR) repeat protein